MSKPDELDENIEKAKERMDWHESREPTMLEYLRNYKSGTIGEVHIEAALEALIADQEQRIRAEAFEQGQIMATESLDDGLIVLMASTSEKLEAAIEHHKKAGWVASGAIRGNPHVLQQVMIKRLAKLKGVKE